MKCYIHVHVPAIPLFCKPKNITSLPLFMINSITTIYQADLNHYMYIALTKVRYISHILYSSIANEDMLK